MKCDHQCSSDCRRKGCNCECGEWHEESVQELAEQELQTEQKYIIRDMMQERYYDYFWDEKHAL